MKNEKSLLEVAPINVKYGGADLRRSAPPCQIPRLSGRNVRIQPPKTVKILIFTINVLCCVCTAGIKYTMSHKKPRQLWQAVASTRTD